MTGDREFAKPVPLFAGLNAEALTAVRDSAGSRSVSAGATFFREGERAAAFSVLDAGSIKLTQLTPEGHQVVLRA